MENLIKRLENVSTELNRKFGTESYELRCELYDIREALEKLHKPAVSNQLCDCKNFTIRAKMLVCKDCGKEHKSLSV